jgi:hypothetical protein
VVPLVVAEASWPGVIPVPSQLYELVVVPPLVMAAR